MIIEYGINMTPFGSALIAKSEKGITDLQFTDNSILAEAKLLSRWQNTHLIRKDKAFVELNNKIFFEHKSYPEIELDLIGTEFQVKVWEALLTIPIGKLSTYGDIAEKVSNNNALRAVGSAVGKNPVQYLVPCHRIIKRDGTIGEYAAGVKLKKAILAFERERVK